METLTLSSDVADITFDAQAIEAIAGAASGDVTISAAQVENSTLSDAAAQVVAIVRSITSASPAAAVRLPSLTELLRCPCPTLLRQTKILMLSWPITFNANGEPELMQNCYYNAEAGALVFTTTHFSQYMRWVTTR
jgi:hypothetical protein